MDCVHHLQLVAFDVVALELVDSLLDLDYSVGDVVQPMVEVEYLRTQRYNEHATVLKLDVGVCQAEVLGY